MEDRLPAIRQDPAAKTGEARLVGAVEQQQRLVDALNASYGIDIVSLGRIDAGTVTDNYVASDGGGQR